MNKVFRKLLMRECTTIISIVTFINISKYGHMYIRKDNLLLFYYCIYFHGLIMMPPCLYMCLPTSSYRFVHAHGCYIYRLHFLTQKIHKCTCDVSFFHRQTIFPMHTNTHYYNPYGIYSLD